MLGEMIGEAKGKRTGRRVLSTESGIRVEVSFEDSGKILGHDFNEIATYWSEVRPDGSLYGEGQAIVLLQNGEAATWKGAGTGTIKPGGAVSYRGTVHYNTASAALAHLNKVAVAFEFEVDAAGNTSTKLWEWK